MMEGQAEGYSLTGEVSPEMIFREVNDTHRWCRGRQNGNGCDNTKSALGANEQLFQIVTGIVLSQCRQLVQDCSIRKDHFEAQYGPVERTIAQESETPRICSDIPANVAAPFRTEINWHDIRVGRNIFGEGFENAARICDQYA